MATQAQLAAVQQLYVGYLGRAADSAGQQFWANAIANGTATIASVATGFTLSAEYKAAYGGLTTDALVEKVYNNVLGRTPDAEGKAFWVAALANGKVTADTLVATIVTNLGALDQQTINNKVFVAQTYTDTAGANYNVAAGTASIVGVDSTAASVSTAIDKITSGSLAGQVPGEGLINALAAAQAAEVAVKTGNTAAVDALVTKLAANVAVGTQTDLLAPNATYNQKLAAIVADADTFRGVGDSTTVLQTKASDAALALTAATAGVTTTADKALVATYTTAVANEASALAAKPTAIVKGNVVGGLDADASATTILAAHGGGVTAAALYAEYVAATPAARSAIDTEFAKSAYFATFKATVVKDAAYVDAVNAKLAAQDALDTDATASTQTVDGVILTHADTVVGLSATDTYIKAALAKTAADALVTKAVAADADVAAVKAITDANKVANTATVKAGTDIAAFNADAGNIANKVEIKAIGAVTADPAVKETFYFAAKPTGLAGDDVAITTFGAGDSIVLGSNVAYNAAGMGAANNNAAEFFLVKTDAGMQVVIENTVYGSAGVTPSATTGVGAPTADNLTVITLTGVTAEHLSVANGVISYV